MVVSRVPGALPSAPVGRRICLNAEFIGGNGRAIGLRRAEVLRGDNQEMYKAAGLVLLYVQSGPVIMTPLLDYSSMKEDFVR